MFKRVLAICGVVALIVAMRPIYFVGVAFGLWQPLSRPAGVSERARYVGTLKTEEWFDCSVDSAKNVDTCQAWDNRGNLIAFGDYRLDGESRAATRLELRPSMVNRNPRHPNLAWICLFEGRKTFGKLLVPVGADGRPLERFEVHVTGGAH